MSVTLEVRPDVFTVVDDEDIAFVLSYNWTPFTSRGSYGPYLLRGESVNGKVKGILLHRAILERAGVNINGLVTDHINGDTLDNRRSNLRAATRSENGYNRGSRRGSTSQYKGVAWSTGHKKWSAYITKDKRQRRLGYFASEIEAALAFDEAARVLHGEFARLNFPEHGAKGQS